MPEVRLDAVDAAELAELLQFLSRWLARDRERLGASLGEFVGHPAYNVGARTWTGSPSCSAATTASPCSALTGRMRPRDRDQPAARAQELRRRRLRRHSFSWRAAQGTGPPLRPPGCCASRCARQPCGLPWTPETTAAPGARKSGQAQACPRAARGAQTPQWRATGASRTPGHW
jgi:hypothetical protein